MKLIREETKNIVYKKVGIVVSSKSWRQAHAEMWSGKSHLLAPSQQNSFRKVFISMTKFKLLAKL